MDRIQRVTWFAGLFEGEGSFNFLRGKPKAMSIQMTDEDVLLLAKEHFGGSIHKVTKRQEHWKDCWKWTISGSDSVELAKEILPFLGKRRSQRCKEYIDNYVTAQQYNAKRISEREKLVVKVFELRANGLTHAQIASVVGKDRTYISHILNGRYGMVGVA